MPEESWPNLPMAANLKSARRLLGAAASEESVAEHTRDKRKLSYGIPGVLRQPSLVCELLGWLFRFPSHSNKS